MSKKYEELDANFITSTTEAVLLDDGYNRGWIPLSVLSEESRNIVADADNYDELTLEVETWFLIKDGWV